MLKGLLILLRWNQNIKKPQENFGRTTNFEGRKVYQRNDIFDPERISSWKINGKKITGNNIQRMAAGRAPIGIDGKPLELHHLIQTNSSNYAEMTKSFHQINTARIHINPNSMGLGINRSMHNAFKVRYWKFRAANY